MMKAGSVRAERTVKNWKNGKKTVVTPVLFFSAAQMDESKFKIQGQGAKEQRRPKSSPGILESLFLCVSSMLIRKPA
jgi:hypothetical protein